MAGDRTEGNGMSSTKSPFTPSLAVARFAVAMTAGLPWMARDHSIAKTNLKLLERDEERWMKTHPDTMPPDTP